MNKSSLPAILLAILGISAVVALVLAYMYARNVSELRLLNAQAAQINNNRAILNALAAESIEYSKKNPAIDPILVSIGAKQPTAAPAPKPAGK